MQQKNDFSKAKILSAELFLPWLVTLAIQLMLVAFLILCLTIGETLQEPLPEISLIKLRTLFYVLAIGTFPMINLIRHIQLKLNATMPYAHTDASTIAKKRYLLTVIVSMALVETVGIYGFVMFLLGDGLNTLYILTGLSALGTFLYRPKMAEYLQILSSLTLQTHE